MANSDQVTSVQTRHHVVWRSVKVDAAQGRVAQRQLLGASEGRVEAKNWDKVYVYAFQTLKQFLRAGVVQRAER